MGSLVIRATSARVRSLLCVSCTVFIISSWSTSKSTAERNHDETTYEEVQKVGSSPAGKVSDVACSEMYKKRCSEMYKKMYKKKYKNRGQARDCIRYS